MWTTGNRARCDRSRLRDPSDVTDAGGELIAPRIPPAKRGGDKLIVNLREVANGLMSVLSAGRQWRAIPKDAPKDAPKDLPPRSTLHDYRGGREASPAVALMDSQSVKNAEKGGAAPIRMGGMRARKSRARSGIYPFLLKLYADGGYQGQRFKTALKKVVGGLNVEIVKRSVQAKGFVVLPKLWVVERTFAWLERCSRLAKDWERLSRKPPAFLKLASIRLKLRKRCNPV